MLNSNHTKNLLFVGSIVPDNKKYITSAFSRAGNMCQIALLKGLLNAGVSISKVLSLRPVPSFPRSRNIIFNYASTVIDDSIKLDFIPFINIVLIKQLSIGFSALCSILCWGWRMRRSEQRIIYVYNISVPPGIFVVLGAWLTKSKCVAMIYDLYVPSETAPATFFNKVDFWLHKKTLPLFDGLVVITDAISEDFAPGVPSLRVEGGISSDLVEQFSAIESEVTRNESIFSIVAVGSLDDVNGFREILDAFKLLQGDRYRLEIAGAGPLESIVRDAASKDDRIRFHGLLPYQDVLKLYAKADVLVNMRLTQRINTRYFFPSKMMEYLTSGIPVISTCPGNIENEYGSFAFLLTLETPEALSHLIRTVADIPVSERLARSRAARDYVIANKSWDVQSKMIVEWFDILFFEFSQRTP